MAKRPALFLDRDGVLIEEMHYLTDVDQVRLIGGAIEAIRRTNRDGFPVVVVTNQSGVARGLFSEQRVLEVHERLDRILDAHGANIRKYYYCPHHPEEGDDRYRMECSCRKPEPGMLQAASRDLGIDLHDSWMIGDRISDLQAGARAGCRTVLVRTGYGQESCKSLPAEDLKLVGIAADVKEAVEWFLHSC
jgi:D-glycero-D-manno-heptose 1,7-bisphosphate phosphatase